MKLTDYLMSRTVWGSFLISFALTPFCPAAWVVAAKAVGTALVGLGVRGAIGAATDSTTTGAAK